METQNLWINKNIFDWYSYISGSSIGHHQTLRSYELWQRAQELLTRDTEFTKIDAIANLKRSLNQRLKLLESIYSFKKMPLRPSPKADLEYLETLGLVRPYMLKQLIQIRNDIEHNDSPPPPRNRCLELLDLIWYFLKSTDHLISQIAGDVFFQDLTAEGNETPYWFEIKIDFSSHHTINIHGWFPEPLIYKNEINNRIKVDLQSVTNKQAYKNILGHENKLESDIYITGTLAPTDEIKFDIIKTYLHSSN